MHSISLRIREDLGPAVFFTVRLLNSPRSTIKKKRGTNHVKNLEMGTVYSELDYEQFQNGGGPFSLKHDFG